MKTRLQELRKKAGFRSAKEFAEKCGIKLGTYTDYEQGRTTMTLERAWFFADIFEVSLDELAGRDFSASSEFADPRQVRLNEAYASLSDSGKTHLVRSAEAECALERGAAGGTPMADVTQQVG